MNNTSLTKYNSYSDSVSVGFLAVISSEACTNSILQFDTVRTNIGNGFVPFILSVSIYRHRFFYPDIFKKYLLIRFRNLYFLWMFTMKNILKTSI